MMRCAAVVLAATTGPEGEHPLFKGNTPAAAPPRANTVLEGLRYSGRKHAFSGGVNSYQSGVFCAADRGIQRIIDPRNGEGF